MLSRKGYLMTWSRFTANTGKDTEETSLRQNSLFSLENMSDFVIEEMKNMPDLSELHIGGLPQIPLGKLRINAVRLHAVCRYKEGVRKTDQISPDSVKCIDIHPLALNDKWGKYANFLLFHEYLHALGFSNHGKEFRRLEALWHDGEAREMGHSFSTYLRNLNGKWLWICPSCDKKHVRSKRSNGRYRCGLCLSSLIDVEANN